MAVLLHGLRASTPVLPGEDASELMGLTERVAADVQPQGVVEEFMAQRVAMGMWRLRRAERAEVGVLTGRLLEVERERAVRLQKRCEVDAFEHLMVREASITGRGRASGSHGAAGRDRVCRGGRPADAGLGDGEGRDRTRDHRARHALQDRDRTEPVQDAPGAARPPGLPMLVQQRWPHLPAHEAGRDMLACVCLERRSPLAERSSVASVTTHQPHSRHGQWRNTAGRTTLALIHRLIAGER